MSCYTYDPVHRNLSTTYSGPNATTNRYFVYDAATVNGQTMANVAGRLAEAYTASSSSGTKVTDEGFSYTARGELGNFYESTPHSAGYYSAPMTYWANGLLNSFGPFLTEKTVSITPDGEGRPYAISGASSAVPSIIYNTASQPTQIMTSCAGSTCYPINYTYDPSTLRMNQYAAALSGGTVSGTLQWNPNGSLQQLVVAGPKNSADVQTCTYGADDLARISSVSCNNGLAWGQQFSYDAFGNLTKSVPANATGIAWQPGYSSSTNRYALNGTSYDANGNVLKDTFNIYTWDAEGKPLSTDYINGSGQTWAFTYDAFGHAVELSSNGGYEYSYLKIGKIRLSAQGQTAQYSEFPLPGGSVLSQNGGATVVQLADWLGTIRAIYSYTGGNEASSSAHAPFGESYAYAGGYPLGFAGNGGLGWGQDGDGNMKNTTYWFPERQYRSSQGRWLSPDPAGLSAADPTNPQSWNRYAYVLNNPLRNIDPTGLECVWDDGSYDSADDRQTGSPVGCSNAGGTYFDPRTFSAPNGDWSNQANAGLAAEVGAQGDYTFRKQVNAPMPANNGSYAWTFTKAFFSNFSVKAVYRSFVDSDGCDRLMATTFADTFNPLPGDGVGASDAADLAPKAAAAAGQAAAAAYSLYQGLSVPLRSSIYRGLQSSTYGYAEAVGTAAPYALVGYAGGKALITAGSAAYNGDCH